MSLRRKVLVSQASWIAALFYYIFALSTAEWAGVSMFAIFLFLMLPFFFVLVLNLIWWRGDVLNPQEQIQRYLLEEKWRQIPSSAKDEFVRKTVAFVDSNSDIEKRKRDHIDNVLRDLSDEELLTLRQRLQDGIVDDDVLYERMVGDDGELMRKHS